MYVVIAVAGVGIVINTSTPAMLSEAVTVLYVCVSVYVGHYHPTLVIDLDYLSRQVIDVDILSGRLIVRNKLSRQLIVLWLSTLLSCPDIDR